MKKHVSTLIKIFVSLGLGIYLAWYLFDVMSANDIEIFKKAIVQSNYWLIGLSLFLALLSSFQEPTDGIYPLANGL